MELKNKNEPNVKDFFCYKVFIEAKIKTCSGVRGYRGQLAQAMNCHASLLSQVLNSEKKHLNLNQLLNAAKFFDLNRNETFYLIDLHSYSKINDESVKQEFFQRAVKRVNADALFLNNCLAEAVKVFFKETYGLQQVYDFLLKSGGLSLDELSTISKIKKERCRSILVSLQTLSLVKNQKQVWYALDF